MRAEADREKRRQGEVGRITGHDVFPPIFFLLLCSPLSVHLDVFFFSSRSGLVGCVPQQG